MRKKALAQIKRDHQTTFNTGRGSDRRKDKLEAAEKGIPHWLRRYRDRYEISGAA